MMTGIFPGKKKRPRWIWLAGTLFLCAVFVLLMRNFAWERVDPLTVEERTWLKAHPVIRLAPDPDFPPVEYFDKKGVYNGITRDYVSLIEKKLGVRFKIVRLRDWNEIVSKAKSREIDIYVATKTPQRSEYLLLTEPFLEFPAVIIAREKVKGHINLEKLNGMKVSVVSEYAAQNFISYNYPKLNLDLVPDVRTGLRKVSFGRSDAFVENLATATYYIEKEGITNLRIAGESGYFYRMGFCSRNDWPELNRILEKGLAEISADEQKAIFKKWIPVEPRSLFTSRDFQIGLLVAVAAILMIIAVIIAWNRALARQVRTRTGELENELEERKLAEEKLRFTQFAVDNTIDQAFWMTEDGRLFYVNDAACQALGYSRKELIGMSIPDIDPIYQPEKFAEHWRELRENGSVMMETLHRAKDGRVYPVEIRANHVVFDGREYNCAFATDISERKRAEEALRRLNRELLALSNCNQTLMRAEDEQALLNDICRIICDEAGYRMAWVGFAEHDDAKTVRPVAWAGVEDGYLAHADINWSDTERGRGPTGTAVRSGENIFIQDFATDPQASPWRENALRRGYRSSVALPLKDDNADIFGVLNIYSTEPNAFTPNEMRLLGELAGDLAFGIMVLRTRMQRKRAEESLRESEQKFRVLAETSPVAIIVYQGEKNVYVNPAATRMIGYTEQDCLAMKFWDWTHEDFKEEVRNRGLARQQGEPVPPQYEFKCVTKSGEEKWVFLSAGCIEYEGAPAGIVSIFDITDRKRMEEELQHAQGELEKRVEERTAELAETVQELLLSRFCIDKAAIGIYHTTFEGDILSANDFACRSLGYTAEELCALKVPDIDPVITQEKMLEIKRMLDETGSATHETVHRRKDGTTFPVEITANNLEFQGKSYTFSFVKDITERKRAEEELRNSEMAQRKLAFELAQKNNFLRTLIDAIPDLIFYKDCNRAYLGCNRAFEAFAGRPEKDLVGRTDLDIFIRDVAVSFRETDLEVLSTEESRRNEEWIDYPDGRRVLLETLKTPFFDLDGEILGVVGVSRDITERKRMEEELLLSHFCINEAAIGIIQVSLDDGKILRVNYSACRSLGYSSDELCTMSIFDIEPSFTWEKFIGLKRTVDQSGSMTFETVGQRKDGTLFPVEITANNLEFHGASTGFSFFKDITERKRAEEALRRAKEEWQRTFASVPDLIAILDNRHRVLRVNEAMANRLGLKPDECVGLHCYEAIHGLSEPPEFCPHTQTLRDGKEHVVEIHEERLGGDFLVSTTPLDDERGVMIGSVHIAYDITERKRAEEALRESESRVRRKLESILDPEGDTGELDLADILDAPEIQALMDDLYRITGLKMSIIDFKGRVLADVGWQDICSKFHRNHPETLKGCHESDTDLTVGVPQGEFKTYRCKNNMWHLVTPIIVGGRHMGNLFMGQFFFADEKIDYDFFRSQARKYGFPEEEYIAALEAVPLQSEELVNLGKAVFLRLTDMFSKLSYANIKLAHSLAERDRLTATLRQANMVVENSPVVLFRWKGDDAWPVELVSGNIKQFGYTPDEFLTGSITYSSIIHPEDLDRVTREVHDFCDERADQFRLEYRIMTKGGDIRWVNEHSNVERDAAGGVKNFEGIVIDVTERKRAEDSIRESREKYQAIVDSFDGLIYISSQDYRIEFMNRKLIERTGRDLVGEYCYRVMNDMDSVCPWCVNDRVFAGETVHREMFSPKDNRWYYVVNVPIRHADGSMSKHSMIIDITERKMFEDELKRQKQLLEDLNETLENRVEEEVRNNREKDIMLIQQNRQAALGEMLDHIAHQWKQPLNSISLIVQGLEETACDGELTDKHVEETVSKIMTLLEHMAQTIEVFRGFYRPDKEKKVFSIKDSIDQALAFIAPVFRFHSIAVELDVDPGLTAFGFPKEYAQVLLNILANARDVFRARGTERPRIIIRAFAEDNKTVVTITDNAGGIPEAIIGRIFDFYFTTNESGGGTGIGLYMSKNIIEKHMGGRLSAANTEGGAQFRIEARLS